MILEQETEISLFVLTYFNFNGGILIIYQKMVKYYQKMVTYINMFLFHNRMNAEEKIFAAFYGLKKQKVYYNQIKEYSNLSHSSLQNALKKLLERKILFEEKTKSNVFYSIRNKKLVSLKFSEIALQKFSELNIGVRIPLQNFLSDLPQDIFSVILFGSASRKEEQKGSDIDLLIVTNEKHDFKQQKDDAELISKYPLSLFECSIQEFIESKDPVILQARKTGFPIFKEQNFFEVEFDD